MNRDTLKQSLLAAPDHEAWVRLVGEYFSRHDLCYGHGTDNPADEAFWLVRAMQDWDAGRWAANPDPALADPVAAIAHARASERVPLAYLLNEAWFAGLRFYVDRGVLVPRSPLAELIRARFLPWIRLAPGDRVLEIGTGSGCIAIAVASHLPEVEVHASDISPAALAVAKRNVAMHRLDDRVYLHEADLFPRAPAQYRVIITNPPYVPEADYAALPAEYHREPSLGLLGGASGLAPVWPILAAAAQHLTADGALFLEVGNEAGQLAARTPGLPLTWLEFEHGGEGVCYVSGQALRDYQREHAFPRDE